ncbi:MULTISPECIES: glutamate--cysteine ligase [Halococcus]|uniref:Glutamate--cysteine ligase n=1 Tax=Halococcus salifodinae DSM 8989 TaxID=1227456 RepID=M0ND87_9EURY|nr:MULTISPECIES: glutamate--cysteine ligase [Halococcus]EMA55831.1 carboxylate-amine ligase [Halococcus salifodinae DSM 8989]
MDVGSAENFTRMGTLGVEEEFYVVDDAGRPTSATDELVYESEPPGVLDGRLDHELFKFIVETQTPTCEGLDEAREQIVTVQEALVEYAAAHGYDIAAAGLHPAARWRELEHAEKPRYRSQLDRIRYPQHRNTTAGVHVHVGVDNAEKATWVANELRWYMPIMLALSANSPYWEGYDTGLASARAKIFEGLPNTGMPTAFAGYEEYARFERLMVEEGSIADRGELWYDVRPHTGHGTVELRAPDGQADPERVIAFVEYAHALVLDLAERYEDDPDPWAAYRSSGGGANTVGDGGLRRELLDENKWRALRDGHDATFIDRDGAGTIGLEAVVDREADRLGVEGIRRLLDAESGATAQRRYRREGGLDAVCAALML